MPDQTNPANEDHQNLSSQNQNPQQSQNQNVGQQRPASEEAEIQKVINQVAGNTQPNPPKNQSPQQPGQAGPQDQTGKQPGEQGGKPSAPKPVVEETSGPPPPTPPTLDSSDTGDSGGLPPLPQKDEGEEKGEKKKGKGKKDTPPPPGSQGGGPPGDIPPVVSSPKPKRKFGGKRLVATVLGILFLVGGIGAGVYLVQQQQDIREEAYDTTYEDCLAAGNTPSECSGLASGTEPTTPSFESYDCREDCFDFGGSAAECSAYPPCSGSDEVDTCTSDSDCQIGRECRNGQCIVRSTSPPDSVNACDRSAPSVAPGPDGRYCTDKTFGSSCETRDGQSGSCQPIGDPTQGTQVECRCAPGGGQAPTSTPTKESDDGPPPSGPDLSAQCLNILAYDTEGNELAADNLAALSAGDTVRFAVSGNTNSGSIDMARFIINGTQRPAVTQKLPGTNLFYDEYTIPEGQESFSINAQLHHTDSSIGWF